MNRLNRRPGASAAPVKRERIGTMAARESKAQEKTVERVMHEFKHGELRSAAGGGKVRKPKQAIAIALSEAGASNRESAKTNAHNLRRTKANEARGETAQAEVEGKRGCKK
jgi:hypothetical protein